MRRATGSARLRLRSGAVLLPTRGRRFGRTWTAAGLREEELQRNAVLARHKLRARFPAWNQGVDPRGDGGPPTSSAPRKPGRARDGPGSDLANVVHEAPCDRVAGSRSCAASPVFLMTTPPGRSSRTRAPAA